MDGKSFILKPIQLIAMGIWDGLDKPPPPPIFKFEVEAKVDLDSIVKEDDDEHTDK